MKLKDFLLNSRWSVPILSVVSVLIIALVLVFFVELNTQPMRRTSFSVKILPFATFCSAFFVPIFFIFITSLKRRSFSFFILIILTLFISYGVGWIYFNWVIDSPFVPSDLHSILLQELASISMPFWLVIGLTILLMKFKKETMENEALESKVPGGKMEASHGGQTHSLALDEIAWAKAEGNYVKLFAKGRFYLKHISLKRLLEAYENRLVRIHKSFLVNLDYVESYKSLSHGDLEVRLTTGDTIKCSRNYTKDLKDSLLRVD